MSMKIRHASRIHKNPSPWSISRNLVLQNSGRLETSGMGAKEQTVGGRLCTPSHAFLPVDRFLQSFPISLSLSLSLFPLGTFNVFSPSRFCSRYSLLNGFRISLPARAKPPGNTFQELCIRLFSTHMSGCLYAIKMSTSIILCFQILLNRICLLFFFYSPTRYSLYYDVYIYFFQILFINIYFLVNGNQCLTL